STRSGTNDFHGAIFNYFRNTVMDANDWFNNAVTPEIPRAPEHHNDFGGVFGGPIRRDRTFFFLSYEGARLDLPQSGVVQVPSACARSAGETCPSGNESASAAIAPYLNAFPQLTGPAPVDPCASSTPGGCVQAFTGSWANVGILDAGSVRIDHALGERFSLFGRYNYAPSQLRQRDTTISLSNPRTINVDTQTLTVGLNMTLNSQKSNFLRSNYSSQKLATSFSLDTFGGAVPLSSKLLLGTLSPATNAGFFFPFDTRTPYILGPQSKGKTRQVNVTDYFAIIEGSHQLKFGGDYRAILL